MFNLSAKTEGEVAENTDAVPDELPDLPPETAAAPDIPVAPTEDVPPELPASPELAPDELPPVDQSGAPGNFGGIPGQEVAPPAVGDRKLYFSNLLQKLHEEGLKSTKLTSGSVNMLTDMKRHWRATKKDEKLQSMERQVAEKLNPLQQLEQEWISLKDEIDEKKQLMRQKEEEIRKLSEELRSLALKTEKMGSGKK